MCPPISPLHAMHACVAQLQSYMHDCNHICIYHLGIYHCHGQAKLCSAADKSNTATALLCINIAMSAHATTLHGSLA